MPTALSSIGITVTRSLIRLLVEGEEVDYVADVATRTVTVADSEDRDALVERTKDGVEALHEAMAEADVGDFEPRLGGTGKVRCPLLPSGFKSAYQWPLFGDPRTPPSGS